MRTKSILAALAVTAAAFACAPVQAKSLDGGVWCTDGSSSQDYAPPEGQPGSNSYEQRTLVQKINYRIPHSYKTQNGERYSCYWLPEPGSYQAQPPQ
jgi:hypothetical protein